MDRTLQFQLLKRLDGEKKKETLKSNFKCMLCMYAILNVTP